MRTAFIVVLLAVLCASFVLSQEVQRPRRVSKYARPCLVLCSALEEEGCEAKCKKPISYVVDLIDRDEAESDGKFIDWLVSLFKRRTVSSKKKPTPKPVPVPVPVDNDDDDDDDNEDEPVPVVVVEPPKPKRTITQEQIWEYFEKMYMSAELGGCKDNKCKMSLPEVVNMKSDKFNFDEWLNTISTKMDQLEPFAKSYEKFLFGLDVPEDLEETIAKNDNVVALTQEIKDREEKVASAEEECKKKYPTFQRMFPEYDTYKERFCVALKNQQQSLMIALGKLHSTKESLMNGWEAALNARKQFLSVPEEFRQTWTKHTSLKSIVEAAKQAQKSTIAIYFNGDSIKGVQNEHAKSGGEEIYPDIIRAAKEDTNAPELDFDNANRNISNAEFLVELGSYHFSKILVQPNSTWFSKSALAQYKSRDEYEEGSGIDKDYFFNSEDGALVGYPESVSVMVQPYISIAVSKTTEEYVRKLKRVAVFNIVFEASEVSSAPCASGNSECVVLTFKKSPENFDPLLFSVKNN